MAATSSDVDDLVLESSDGLSWHHPVDHPEVSYGFCNVCGSTIFWRASDDASRWSVAAGTIDPPTRLRTTVAWFVAEASDYHVLERDLTAFDGEPDDRGAGTTPPPRH
jgi:hypothetical protein